MSSTADRKVPDWASALPQDDDSRPGKRSRVALACQRCKTRKQKCNGTNPCAKCEALDLPCEYVVPQKPMPFGKNQYIKSLERRVAELETLLSTHGLAEPSKDHWVPSSKASDKASSQYADDTPNTDELDPEWQDGGNVTAIFRNLALDVNGQAYTGSASHFTMGKLLGSLMRSQPRRASTFSVVQSVHGSRHGSVAMTSPETSINHLDPAASARTTINFSDMPEEVAERLLRGYWKHIGTRFPVLYSRWLSEVHVKSRRQQLTGVHEIAILHLVYAGAGRFLETAGETGPFHPQRHLASALEHMDEILGAGADRRSVATLVLLAVCCLRDPSGPGAWAYIRLATTIAIELGLHRDCEVKGRTKLQTELDRRLFWAIYAFDRQISIPLGRPFSISDQEIDVPLPLDVDESTTAEELEARAVSSSTYQAPRISTSLSSFIQLVRLRRIESAIHNTVYRVDSDNANVEDEVIEDLLERLEQWRELVPQDASGKRDQSHLDAIPYDGFELYMVHYFKSKRLLLYPQLAKTPVNLKFLKECATSCSGVCGAYKRIHQAMAVGYSLMALQTVFMAAEIFDLTTSNGIHDCSVVLFVIAERVPAARRYRNVFEVIRQQVMDLLSDTNNPPRPRMSLSAGQAGELAASTEAFAVDQTFEGNNIGLAQFSHIISDLSRNVQPEASTMAADPFNTMPDEYAMSQSGMFDYNNVGFGVSPSDPSTDSLAAWFAAAHSTGNNRPR
ncbi:fungal-specific transcription factor domain-containing protein [Microdochium trichocladiopsis]|uniref:Fungal-specific transcription factor domain-containing protein n=1 Tax=Microdochium trichocladiopsis TaxID=1682393 RepID=A0A9P9BN15_9PEZI|nr:fungal-specific transcription factor domain-containing protein [Microdochium trichocladiopsis]KAH7027251.1 fungal-specific transcription factor domain-containing protein [Microdochium trichocladiopsis]